MKGPDIRDRTDGQGSKRHRFLACGGQRRSQGRRRDRRRLLGVRVPAQAVADARAGWSALRAEAGEDAPHRIYEAMAATLPWRLEAAARDLMDGRPNEKTIDSLVNDLVWRHVVGH